MMAMKETGDPSKWYVKLFTSASLINKWPDSLLLLSVYCIPIAIGIAMADKHNIISKICVH